MKKPNWTYTFRIMKRNPDQVPMDRLGQYICEFAELIGKENKPIFKSVTKKSTGLAVKVPEDRISHVSDRFFDAANDPISKPGKVMSKLKDMLLEDGLQQAQLIDSDNNLIYLFESRAEEAEKVEKIHQYGFVDGVVVGLVGADATMHLHLRDSFNRDLRIIVKDEGLARQLLTKFRNGVVRLSIHGVWVRTENGWVPQASKCTVDSFESLDESDLASIFDELRAVPDNGWSKIEDPLKQWEEIRGIH